jgi:hypothetical protein
MYLGGVCFVLIYIGLVATGIQKACRSKAFRDLHWIDSSACKHFEETTMKVTVAEVYKTKSKNEGCRQTEHCSKCRDGEEAQCRYYFHSYYHPIYDAAKSAYVPCYHCTNCIYRSRYHWLFHKYHLAYGWWELTSVLARKIIISLPGLFFTTQKLEAGICLALTNSLFFCLTVTFQPYLTDAEDREHQILNNRTSTENLKVPKYCSRKRCGINTTLDASLLLAEIFLSFGCILTALAAPVGAIAFFEFTAFVIFVIAILFLFVETLLFNTKELKATGSQFADKVRRGRGSGEEKNMTRVVPNNG